MRVTPRSFFLLIPCLLAGCASGPPDAKHDNFFAGAANLMNNGYQNQTNTMQAQLEYSRAQQAEAERRRADADAKLRQGEQSLSVLRSDTARLGRSLSALQVKADRIKVANANLSEKDHQLLNDLTDAKLRLANLQLQLKTPNADSDYDQVKAQHDKLQASIEILSQQLAGASAQ